MHKDHESNDPAAPFGEPVIRTPRLPAAAKRSGNLFLLTVLSAVDGTLVMLAASGKLSTLGGAIVVGLTVIAGAGSWIAAKDAFGSGPLARSEKLILTSLAAVTIVAATAAVWLGATLGQAVTLHILPKAAGVVMLLIGAEIAGLKMPRPAGVPLPLIAISVSALLEVYSQWNL